MIEWDEIKWGRAIGIIILALVIIAGAIFVVNDYIVSNRLKAKLEAQLDDLGNFYATYKPPSAKDLERMQAQIEDFKKELAKLRPRLETSLDPNSLENKIRERANWSGVSVDELNFSPVTTEGFLILYPVSIQVSGPNTQLSRFMMEIDNLGLAKRTPEAPAISGNTVKINYQFLAFDLEDWNKSYSCNLGVTLPRLEEVNINRIKIFKDNLSELKQKVELQKAKLSDASKALDKECEIQKEISAYQERIKLSKELAK